MFASCQQEDAQTMLFEEEITTLIVKAYSCANDPLCPVKTPEINASVDIFEYVNNPNPNDAFLLLSGKTDVSGTFQNSSLEGSNYYFIRIVTEDNFQQDQLIRLDLGVINEVEFLLP